MGRVGVRGCAEPELAHPAWNTYKKALKTSCLDEAAMKLTIIANYGHGAYVKGDRLLARQEYLRSFLEKQDSSYFQVLSEEIMMDKGVSDVDEESASFLLSDWMECKSIKNRGGFVPLFVQPALLCSTLGPAKKIYNNGGGELYSALYIMCIYIYNIHICI